MKTHRVLFALAIVLALAGEAAFAAATTPAQAATLVANWLQQDPVPLGANLGRQIAQTTTFKDAAGAAAYYVVSLNPDGYVIVPADDQVEPILGFSVHGSYAAGDDNPMGALVERDAKERVACVRAVQARGLPAPGDPAVRAQAKWSQLLSPVQSRGLASVSDPRVAPLLQSKWSQTTVSGTACYNYYVPPNAAGSAGNYPDGCVATAMAQLMRFHQYPIGGVGTATYTVYVDGHAQSRALLGGDGSGGAYSWPDMPLLPGSSMTVANRQAIGRLCADAGTVVGMSYSAGGSGATMDDASDALRGVFQFQSSICGENYYSGLTLGGSLTQMINPNLDAGLPVLLGITGSAGGHAIVCDGYGYNSATLYHHLNMGWAETDDAWYALPNIDASYTFDTVVACVYNVFKSGSGEIVSGRVLDNGGNPLGGVSIQAVSSGGTFTATTNSGGIYALSAIPSSTTFTVSASRAGYTFGSSQPVSTARSQQYSGTCGNKWGINFTGTASGVSGAPAITSAASSQGVVGKAFAYTITASNTPASFGATGLPAGLSVDTVTGAISGTPAAQGSYSVQLSATNSAGTGTATLALSIASAAPQITSALDCHSVVNAAFLYTITASNSPTSYGASGLPAGLSLNISTGAVTGTPLAQGAYSVQLSATNAGGTGTAMLSLTVTAPAPAITSALKASATEGQPFSYQIAASNSPTRYGAAGLPEGLSIDTATGLISGTPVDVGTASVVVSATNLAGTGSATLSLVVSASPNSPVISSPPSASPNPATVDDQVAFSAGAGDSDGDRLSYEWDFGDGSIGNGAATSHIYPDSGTYTVTLTVSDGSNEVSRSLTLEVAEPAVPLTVKSAAFRLNPRVPGADALTLSGYLPLGAGFEPAGEDVCVKLGGLEEDFTLDGRGSSGRGKTMFKLAGRNRNGVFSGSALGFSLALSGIPLSSVLGLADGASPVPGATYTVPVLISVGGGNFSTQLTVVAAQKSRLLVSR